VLNASWGLAEDVLTELDSRARRTKVLLAQVDDQVVAVREDEVLQVVDSPRVSGWIERPYVVGVFSLRGAIYALTDPAGRRCRRTVALVLDQPSRCRAVG
jgi:chemotaxis signal transduction protein